MVAALRQVIVHIVLLAATVTTHAQINDECVDAKPMICGDTDTVFISDGFTSGDDPTSSCEIAGGGPFAHDASWWYEFTAPANVFEVTVSMCQTADIEDVVVTMFTADSTCADLQELECDDDACVPPGQFGPSEFAVPVTPGASYVVLVDRYTGGASTDGPYIIEFLCDGFGACCTAKGCMSASEEECSAAGGLFSEGTCAGVDCPDCFADGECEDGDPCTSDACVAGACVSTPLTCPEGQQCDPADGECKDCLGPADCDDGAPCTEDLCVGGLCEHPEIVCPDGQLCDPQDGVCRDCLSDPDCDDGDACTIDACTNGTCTNTGIDCGELADDCNAGECIHGICQRSPINEGGACNNEAGVCVLGSCQDFLVVPALSPTGLIMLLLALLVGVVCVARQQSRRA